jgi:hypothetical protein
MYIGNDLQIAHPSYKIIDDISSGFNGSTTSFALQVSGATPVPFPISTQQVMISVNGVVQEPDPNGSAGFKLLGSNIVFSSAPANGHAFFGVINAGADYVTAGSEFPDGSATAPSFTFQDDQDTGWFRSGSGAVGFSANGVNTIGFDGNGLTVTGDATFAGDSSKNLFWDKSDGQLEFADNAKAVFGTGSDLQIYHNGSSSYLTNSTGNLILESDSYIWLGSKTSSETYIKGIKDGAVELYYDNSLRFQTDVNGCTVHSTRLQFMDNTKAQFGTGGDFQIFHDGSNSFVQDVGTGNLYLRGTNKVIINDTAHAETYIECTKDGSVDLYYNNTKRAETTNTGFTVTGELHIDSNGSLIKENQLKFSPSGAAYIDHSTVSQNIIFRTSSSSALDTTALTLASNGNGSFAGTVSDSKGNLRSIPLNTQSSAYVAVAADAGKTISISSGGVTINASVFSAGDAVTIINNSGSDQTITSGSGGMTLHNTADAATGNRTLAGRGMATIYFLSSGTAYISGAGLS